MTLERRLQYLEIDEADRARLRAIAPLLAGAATSFVETFYRHLFRFEETARFLQDPQLVARLKKAQQEHLESMLEAGWNDAYVGFSSVARRIVSSISASVSDG